MFSRSVYAGGSPGLVGLRRIASMIALTLPLATCTPPDVPATQAGVTDVAMQGIAFVPKTVTIRQGDSVRWTNLESAPIVHTTTSGDPDGDAIGTIWASGNLSPGESFTRQFNESGTFEYFCEIHPRVAAMRNATVIVEP